MTRLSATATIAALLLLAIAQGFGATKVTAKAATKSTAKPYHLTAHNQFHVRSRKDVSKAGLAQERQRQTPSQNAQQPPVPGHPHRDNALAAAGRNAAPHTTGFTRTRAPRRNQANPPPSGTLGFVSATAIPDGGRNFGDVRAATANSLAAFITVVYNGTNYVYSEVTANGDGTFNTLTPVLPAVPTPTACACGSPLFTVGDVDGDGNTDIVEAVNPGSLYVFLSHAGDGTFTQTAASPIAVTANNITGGTLVTNATSTFLDGVIVDGATPSNIITIPGNGDGTFAAALTPVPLVPSGTAQGSGYNVILADFDGDGLIDVAENDGANPQQLNVYLAATTPTAYTGAAVANPDGVYDNCNITFGSLTGSSGMPAIIEVACDTNSIVVYNNTAGAFSEGVYYPVALGPTTTADTFPEGATIADVNGDGNGDVVVSNDDSADVTILLGNGDGTLQTTSVGYATGGYPVDGAIVMDLNGDGFADILLADDNQSLVWMAGYGDGSFQAAKNFYGDNPGNSFPSSWGVASGDLNGDGFADVVTGNFGNTGTGITVFLSNPDGSLGPGVNYGASGSLANVAVADFNGDGKLDIAASDEFGSVEIFTGTGTGTFIEGSIYFIGGCCQWGILANAFNSSTAPGTGVAGFNDIAVLNSSGIVTMLINDTFGGFTVNPLPALTAGGQQMATADLNGDTFLDLAIAENYGAGNVGVLLGNGDGTFGAESLVATGCCAYGIALADIDGDGVADMVLTDNVQSIGFFIGKGDGTFLAPFDVLPSSLVVTGPAFSFYNPDPYAIQVADVNGDGIADLVYTNSDYGTVGVMFGTGTGSNGATPAPYFYDPVEYPTASFGKGVTVTDVNGDGTPDAVSASDDVSGAGVLINANGSGAAPNYSLSVDPGSINVSDGGTGTATITLTPVNFYNGTVTFSCTGLPLKMTCTFAPATLVPAGNFSLSTTVTVTTKAPHGALRMPADPHQGRTSLLACLTGMGLFGLLLAGDWKNKRNRRVGILLGILVLGMMFSLVGCSSSTPGTPIGAQSVTITATGSDGVNNAANLTVNVF